MNIIFKNNIVALSIKSSYKCLQFFFCVKQQSKMGVNSVRYAMDSRSSTKDLSSSHSSESEDSELEESRDAFRNVEPYAYEPFVTDSSESGESDNKEDTDAEERLNTDSLA